MNLDPREPPEFPPPWAMAWGDDRYGLWADLDVAGVVQRLRWIEPGEFVMGSDPESDASSLDREQPAHRVRLTRGFWLANTACTQALWRAVMGSNPSHFEGDDMRPVEQVNFEQVDDFLQRLKGAWTEGCAAELPTEAEWEYACRAGTTTAYHTGAELTDRQANFGAYERAREADRKALKFAGSTLQAKHYPPNDWGQYQMHGNVWEWCADAPRNYAETALLNGVLENPWGPREQGPEALRAVRGGSWFGDARRARSAFRYALRRRVRDHYLGFRFALRSRSPETPEGGHQG